MPPHRNYLGGYAATQAVVLEHVADIGVQLEGTPPRLAPVHQVHVLQGLLVLLAVVDGVGREDLHVLPLLFIFATLILVFIFATFIIIIILLLLYPNPLLLCAPHSTHPFGDPIADQQVN